MSSVESEKENKIRVKPEEAIGIPLVEVDKSVIEDVKYFP